jgi:hypothetical protein
VAVVSKGDEELLKAAGQNAWYFPQTLDGEPTWAHPVNSLAAIAHVEALRLKGADFLLFPGTACWWLEHYDALRKHLRKRYQELPRHDACRIFDLRERQFHLGDRRRRSKTLSTSVAATGLPPSILDWNSGLQLLDPDHAVFSPPPGYHAIFGQSVDIAVPHDPRWVKLGGRGGSFELGGRAILRRSSTSNGNGWNAELTAVS